MMQEKVVKSKTRKKAQKIEQEEEFITKEQRTKNRHEEHVGSSWNLERGLNIFFQNLY